MPLSLTLRTAQDVDLQDVYALVFENPEKHIRKLAREDIGTLIGEGVLWIARDHEGRLVGCCYVKVPLTTEAEMPPAEYGGAFVRAEHRGLGIGEALARLAIARFMWDNDPESLPALIAHVHAENEKPRTVLAKLGFRLDKRIKVPEGLPGFEHMPKASDGFVHGDEFAFEAKKIAGLLRDVARVIAAKKIVGKNGGETPVGVNLKTDDFTPENLEKMASAVEAKAK